jgi:hypothetical protein
MVNGVLQEYFSSLLSSGQNPEECDARDDDSSTTAGNISIYLIFYPGNAGTDWVDFCGLTGYICQSRLWREQR